MYRASAMRAQRAVRRWTNALLHQPAERLALGFQVPYILPAGFQDHLSELSDEDESVTISDDDDHDETTVTAIRTSTTTGVQIDVNHLSFGDQLVLEPGCDVELEDQSFLRILEYLPDSQYIRGHRFLLQNHWELLMPERDHELVLLVKADNNLNTEYPSSLVPATAVIRHCKIVFTNQQYRNLNYRKDVQGFGGEDDNRPIYFCRYTSTDTNVGMEDGNPNSPPIAGRIEHLRSSQSDNGVLTTKHGSKIELKIPDEEVRSQWRGATMLRGSHIDEQFGIRKQKYSYGDCFCGAGGTSSGALSAGLGMRYAFDLDTWATETYAANFGHTGMQILQTDVYDFVRSAALSSTYKVDILHLSPPCQPFCGANRTPNEENDRRNLAAFARVSDLLEICKPRIATLEEAKSLTDVDKRTHFRRLISCFIRKGYSVQWKALELSTFGVPQTRNRTIIIASGPGEKLPPFLRPTHSDVTLGLKTPPSIGQALRSIPVDAIHHDEIAQMRAPKQPYDDNKLCQTILTAPKPYHWHPSGLRRFSIREFAALQTFPHDFIFVGASAADRLKQIGNAVPPLFAYEMFRHLKTELRNADDAEARGDAI